MKKQIVSVVIGVIKKTVNIFLPSANHQKKNGINGSSRLVEDVRIFYAYI